jgi:hypothetical protein
MNTSANMEHCLEQIAENIMYEMWFSVAEQIFQKVCDVTELDEEQITALRSVALRPKEFQVIIE